jgi:small subunit ribosomal protein S14
MKYLPQKDKKKRSRFKKYESLKIVLRYLIRREGTPLQKTLQLTKDLRSLPRRSSLTQLRNRCVITGRSRGVLRPFSLSRIKMRELISHGLIPGFSKIVW